MHMKILKTLCAFLGAAVMAVSAASFTAFAENPDKVVDNACILSDSEEDVLEEKINDIIEKYDYSYDIVVHTTNRTFDKSIGTYADDYYDNNDYGYDSEASGIIFVVDMIERNAYISTCGKAIEVFGNKDLDRILDQVTDCFSEKKYFSGTDLFATLVDDHIYKYERANGRYDSDILPAVSNQLTTNTENNPDKVIDDADILSDTEELALQGKIEEVIGKYNQAYDIVILTTNGTGGKRMVDFADDYYDYNGYGYDAQASGLIFVLDMSGREMYISTCGRAIGAFTDYGIDVILDEVIDLFSGGNYYSGLNKFVVLADDYIDKYESTGIAYDVSRAPAYSTASKVERAKTFLVSALVGLIISLVICLSLRSQLKSAKMQTNAQPYIRTGSFRVTNAREYYLYKNVTRTKIERSSGGGGRGGSSTHRSSSGRSHGGRGRRF